ncbi:SPOC like C-terminal domain-containing protein [Mycena rosella]|uniref:ATP-dependent DNA helicase II subunit 1 n=1 Tax=Mycena rosella TaxID=1033263 RepID=A0AAD7FTN2_MYCRO|nr:SPOC like C-terminal domain-containing protein [Mycena rosella]
MPPYDDWNKIDDEEDEELQDISHLESRKDVILFSPRRPCDEKAKTCHAYAALDAAMQIQKKKVIVGPNDAVGILLFNTVRYIPRLLRKAETSRNQGSEIKKNCFVYQPIAPLSAPKIQELIQLLDAFREDPEELKNNFPPIPDGKRVAMGDVFTSCNWVLRDGAPKTASKRVFLITDEDDPHAGPSGKQLVTSARNTLIDLTQAGVTPFDVSKFYSSVLLPNNLVDEDDIDEDDPSVLPESISISRIEDLLAQMRFHEVPKRALFSIPFELADGFTIGVKGYGLVTEQKKGAYKYFVDLGERMEVATVRTTYVDEVRQAEVEKPKMLYGMEVGGAGDDDDAGTRVVQPGQRPFYTAEDIRSFRTLGREPGLKLLGFKDRSELLFEDNIKHSQFIYPDEMTYAGSKRTFSALLKSMVKKKKMGVVLSLTRRNASPTFCALLPQEERVDEGGWTDPAGFHLIPLPFADDIRAAPVERGCRGTTARTRRTRIRTLVRPSTTRFAGSYPPPALAFHNAQLQATAFGEEFDAEAFEDLTEPKADMIHKRAGKLLEAWKAAVANDESSFNAPVEKAAKGTKRKADVDVSEAEIMSRYSEGLLNKARRSLAPNFLKSKGKPTSGKKAELVERVEDYLASQ